GSGVFGFPAKASRMAAAPGPRKKYQPAVSTSSAAPAATARMRHAFPRAGGAMAGGPGGGKDGGRGGDDWRARRATPGAWDGEAGGGAAKGRATGWSRRQDDAADARAGRFAFPSARETPSFMGLALVRRVRSRVFPPVRRRRRGRSSWNRRSSPFGKV